MNAKPAETEAGQTPQRKKFNAQRSALRALGETAMEGFDFEVVKVPHDGGTGYIWRKLEAAPAPKPDAEVAADPEAAPATVARSAPAAPVSLIAFTQIRLSDLNPRRSFDDESLAELAESIAANGILQNVVVRVRPAGGYELVAGERRMRAVARLIGRGDWDGRVANIPAKIIEGDDAEVLALALLENLQREAVNPMEEAEGMAALHRLNPARWSTAEIARRIGKTPRHVQLRLALTDRLTDDTRAALRDGRINLAQARAITGMPAAIQAKTVKAIAERKSWTLRAEDLHVGIYADLVPAARAIFDPGTAGVEVVEGEGGERWLEKDAFLAAQKAAVEQKVADLATEWAWVKTKSYFYAGAYQEARTEDRAVGGAVVVLDHYGTVVIETGLQKFEPLGRDHDAEAAAHRAERASRDAAMQELQARLWDGLHGDETAALALCAFGLLCHHTPYAPRRATQIGGEIDFTTPRLREVWSELVRFETDERRGQWDSESDDSGLHFTPGDDRAGLFAQLLTWTPARLSRLIAAIAADSVVVDTSQSAPDPATAALLARFAAPLPAFWQPEAGRPEPEPADPAIPATEELPT